MIIWLNGPFGIGKTTTAHALLRRVPQAVLFDPELFGTARWHTVDNVETVTDFQDLRGWPALVVETARILLETYAETLVMPLTVVHTAAAEALAAGLAEADLDVRRFRLVAPEATFCARESCSAPRQRDRTTGVLDHLEAAASLMANAAFGDAVLTDDRHPEQVANDILVRLVIARRVATDADRAFARRAHHLAFRELVERRFGAWIEEQQDQFFESSWAALPHEIILFRGEPCGYASV